MVLNRAQRGDAGGKLAAVNSDYLALAVAAVGFLIAVFIVGWNRTNRVEGQPYWRPRFQQLPWMIVIAFVLFPIAYALGGTAYSRVIYYFVVGPILAVLWFPMAYAANRWLGPAISRRLRMSR
jgi:hypothetical protein